jgi:anti-sigma regulatory factor (Ser/Thr protein kinase)
MASPLTLVSSAHAMEIPIASVEDCVAARPCARAMAAALGFHQTASEEVALIVAELASNLVKHAGRGTLILRQVLGANRTGIEIESRDTGPGISDIERSFTDGFSTRGSLGYGLGSVNRLMDEVDVCSAPNSGTKIICRKWIPLNTDRTTIQKWDVGAATRALHNSSANGDSFVIRQDGDALLVGLIDGLGHGELAQIAALAAQRYVRTHAELSLDAIFLGVGRACRATRGVVMTIARFHSPSQMSFAAVGNIETRACCGGERSSFPITRGIVGAEISAVRVQDIKWKQEWILVLHSDGLHSRWQWSDFNSLAHKPAGEIARVLLTKLATGNDDATVLVVKQEMP